MHQHQAPNDPIDLSDELALLHAYSQTSTSTLKQQCIFDIYPLLHQLMLDLVTRDYQPQRYRCFAVLEPKVREIFAPSFRDRLVHHLLMDRLAPLLDRRLISDSFANRAGGGTQKAVARLQYFMRRLPANAYIMQCDIATYFPSIDRRILYQIVKAHVERLPEIIASERDLILELTAVILAQEPSQNPIFTGNRHLLAQIPEHKRLGSQSAEVGMPIGSLTSQVFSNLYLNELDRFVKHELRAPYYLRYVDDFVLLHQDSAQLALWHQQIQEFLHKRLALKLHPRKTIVQPISRGSDYLGYIVRPHSLQIRPRTIKALRRRLYFFNHLLDPVGFPHRNTPPETKLARYLRQGLIKPPIIPTLDILLSMLQVVNSYYGLMAHADTYQLRRRLYLQEFQQLQHYFLPGPGFAKVILRPLRVLKREGRIAL